MSAQLSVSAAKNRVFCRKRTDGLKYWLNVFCLHLDNSLKTPRFYLFTKANTFFKSRQFHLLLKLRTVFSLLSSRLEKIS